MLKTSTQRKSFCLAFVSQVCLVRHSMTFFFNAFHVINHRGDTKNKTKLKTPPSKQMKNANANRQVCSPSKRDPQPSIAYEGWFSFLAIAKKAQCGTAALMT